jgi:hypothetical protein
MVQEQKDDRKPQDECQSNHGLNGVCYPPRVTTLEAPSQ